MEEELIRFCAPTLAGIKSAGAFGYPYFDVYALQNRIQRLNQRLLPKGVLILPLRLKEGRALIYAFRPSMLPVDLSHPIAQGVLSAYKYPKNDIVLDLFRLAERLEEGRFPHEMGLFLGYPPLDVLGFILNGGEHYKKAGLWKVYADEDGAKKRFALYKQYTAAYLDRYLNGAAIEELVQ